jgi:hypothetical protein
VQKEHHDNHPNHHYEYYFVNIDSSSVGYDISPLKRVRFKILTTSHNLALESGEIS